MSDLVAGPAPTTSDDELNARASVTADRRRPAEITRAIQLCRKGQREESRNCLFRFLGEKPGQVEALLWLAKVTSDPLEAVVSANMASILDPTNEIARRAVAEVHQTHIKADEQGSGDSGLSLAIGLQTGMTLAQARSVIWSIRDVNRPIGEILDDGTITLRDLGWAVENAWSDRIRDAAKTILLTRIIGAEPKDQPRGLRVIRGSRFTEDREREATIDLGTLYGVFVTLNIEIIAVAVMFGLLDLLRVFRLPLWGCALLLLSLGLSWIGTRLLARRRETADAYQAGRRGEEKAVEELSYWLDGRWTVFRNLEFPNRSWGDVDLVLVGPRGTAAIEVKAYSSRVRNIGDRWWRKTRRGWRRLTSDPGRQATRNAANLHEYLRRHGVDVGWVEAAVLWAGDSDLLTVEDPAVPVWRIDEIGDRFDELWTRKPMAEDTVRQAVAVLEGAIHTSDRGAGRRPPRPGRPKSAPSPAHPAHSGSTRPDGS